MRLVDKCEQGRGEERRRVTGVGANSTAAARASAHAFQFPAKVRALNDLLKVINPPFALGGIAHGHLHRAPVHRGHGGAVELGRGEDLRELLLPVSSAHARPRSGHARPKSLRWAACEAGCAACEWSRRAAEPDEGRLLLEEALGDQHIAHCLCEIARAPACVYGPHCRFPCTLPAKERKALTNHIERCQPRREHCSLKLRLPTPLLLLHKTAKEAMASGATLSAV